MLSNPLVYKSYMFPLLLLIIHTNEIRIKFLAFYILEYIHHEIDSIFITETS